MRAVVQKVTSAAVSVDGQIVSFIERGLCLLVGICNDDTLDDIQYLVNKIVKMRLFEDKENVFWKKSVKDLDLEILSGNKPDFRLAMKTDDARYLYQTFLKQLGEAHSQNKIKDGVFGAMMKVDIVNDGPVTILLDSKDKT